MVTKNFMSHPITSAVLLLSSALLLDGKPEYQAAYELQHTYAAPTFFDNFTFSSGPDDGAFTVYVDGPTAAKLGLARIVGSQVYMSADNTTIATAPGRRSVQISSNANYSAGLFIIDLDHQPTGCGTWPAFWMCGPNWPYGGEIDIIEGINGQPAVRTTLHTDAGCSMAAEDFADMTGFFVNGSNGQPATNCDVNAANQYPNEGCSVSGALGSMGNAFNDNGGGVYATEWLPGSFIRMWFWPRGAIPADVTAAKPVPDSWGLPYALFQLGANCPSSHFVEQQIVFDLALCGWAGGEFSSMCPGLGTCEAFVGGKPSAFSQAYWLINYVQVFQLQQHSQK
eukprot:TRINITY_DN14210_c0_g1_i1.p1 TRINITY_DN14210_c0_g1~~TRINITY_DN14210_c0_g1_i1.p1  ORF type:complete len:347 (-),score=134.92 TRINITY_DN14210_c0_g1_i1:493-1509(-)